MKIDNDGVDVDRTLKVSNTVLNCKIRSCLAASVVEVYSTVSYTLDHVNGRTRTVLSHSVLLPPDNYWNIYIQPVLITYLIMQSKVKTIYNTIYYLTRNIHTHTHTHTHTEITCWSRVRKHRFRQTCLLTLICWRVGGKITPRQFFLLPFRNR